MTLSTHKKNNEVKRSPGVQGYYSLRQRTQSLRGWAFDSSSPRESVCVEIFADNQRIASMLADEERADLKKLGTGYTKYGFECMLDELPVRAGAVCNISVRVKGSDVRLNGNKTSITAGTVSREKIAVIDTASSKTEFIQTEVQTVALNEELWEGDESYRKQIIGLQRKGRNEERYFQKNKLGQWAYSKNITDATFSDALVIMPMGIVIVNGRVLHESTYLANYRRTYPILSPKHPSSLVWLIRQLWRKAIPGYPLDEYILRTTQEFEETIPGSVFLLGGSAYKSYYHWHVDILPSVKRLERFGNCTPEKILCPAPSSSWHRDSLKLVCNQYPVESRLLFSQELQVFRIEKLHYTTGLGGADRSFLSPDISAFYDQLIEGTEEFSKPDEVGEHLYLTRRNEERRKLLNENEIERLLSERGFTVINPSDYDYKTQIGIFRQAKTIVSPHGAALTNLLFSSSDVQVIELFPDCYVNPALQRIANAKRARYAYIVGKATRTPGSSDIHDFTFTINESALTEVVDRLCANG